ncbi:hypothetical protein B296_00003217 [Ensete ventricosum]|uniref:RNA exonuclease 4 n=1 Tax=Ensete ventricosum TaxID=4639 RepID=A0A427AA75_ENSVE|nr:hypothetical protein B296_00003217 [Ensete ventricosum]
MRVSFHSVHEPKCGVCQKHCRFFESLREHLIDDIFVEGPLPKIECARVFRTRGCNLCLNIFESPNDLRTHRASCQLSRAASVRAYLSDVEDELAGLIGLRLAKSRFPGSCFGLQDGRRRKRWITRPVCQGLPDRGRRERHLPNLHQAPNTGHKLQVPFEEHLILHSNLSRYETTGIRPEYLRDAMPLKQAQRRIQDFLSNGEPIWKIRSRGGKARILVGHGLDHDLECLGVEYPEFLIRYLLHPI